MYTKIHSHAQQITSKYYFGMQLELCNVAHTDDCTKTVVILYIQIQYTIGYESLSYAFSILFLFPFLLLHFIIFSSRVSQ